MDVSNYSIELPRAWWEDVQAKCPLQCMVQKEVSLQRSSPNNRLGLRTLSVTWLHTWDKWSQLLPAPHPAQEWGKWPTLTCIERQEGLRPKTWSSFPMIKVTGVFVCRCAMLYLMWKCVPHIVQTLLPSLRCGFPVIEASGCEFTAKGRGWFFNSKRS